MALVSLCNLRHMSRFVFGILLSSCLLKYGSGKINPRNDQDWNEESSHSHVFREGIPQLATRTDVTKQTRMSHDHIHQLIFVIPQNNMEELERILYDVSDPDSLNYGRHLSHKEVSQLTANLESRDVVVNYLQSKGVVIISETLNGEYITADASITIWETMLNTEFYSFHQTLANGRLDKLVRAEKYFIPRELDSHVESVFRTIEMPIYTHKLNPITRDYNSKVSTEYKPKSSSESSLRGDRGREKEVGNNGKKEVLSYNPVTPAILKSYYNVGSATGSAASTQCVFEGSGQYWSPSDLAQFQNQFSLPNSPVTAQYGGRADDSHCASSFEDCAESMLDLEYIMATSLGSPTTYWYTTDYFDSWLTTVASTPSPPLVLSISYGSTEESVSSGILDAFSTQAIKLGTMGVTIVVSSGDDGANSGSTCGYSPNFPASNPYVVTVGATSGPEYGTTEIVCSKNTGQIITSGGGFSIYYPAPSYQTSKVAGYFTAAAAAGQTPYTGYAAGNRGYPDISMAGASYTTVIGGNSFLSSGTSASAPVVAAFFSNINAARIASGRGSLGFVNPFLYSKSSSFINDVTLGHNRCTASGTCCSQGYYAASGWDPATGLGSMNYGKLAAAVVALGTVTTVAPSTSPTSPPSVKPATTSPTNTASPSITVRPSISFTPTFKPSTFSPTVKPPTYTPTTAPPTCSPTTAPSSFKPTSASPSVPAPTSNPSVGTDTTADASGYSTPFIVEIVGGGGGGMVLLLLLALICFCRRTRSSQTVYGNSKDCCDFIPEESTPSSSDRTAPKSPRSSRRTSLKLVEQLVEMPMPRSPPSYRSNNPSAPPLPLQNNFIGSFLFI